MLPWASDPDGAMAKATTTVPWKPRPAGLLRATRACTWAAYSSSLPGLAETCVTPVPLPSLPRDVGPPACVAALACRSRSRSSSAVLGASSWMRRVFSSGATGAAIGGLGATTSSFRGSSTGFSRWAAEAWSDPSCGAVASMDGAGSALSLRHRVEHLALDDLDADRFARRRVGAEVGRLAPRHERQQRADMQSHGQDCRHAECHTPPLRRRWPRRSDKLGIDGRMLVSRSVLLRLDARGRAELVLDCMDHVAHRPRLGAPARLPRATSPQGASAPVDRRNTADAYCALRARRLTLSAPPRAAQRHPRSPPE